MSDESRWNRLECLYHGALAQPSDTRADWLALACGDDEILRDEVEALLRHDARGETLLEVPIVALPHDLCDGGESLLGHQIDGYEVTAFIGAGGMGDVYRARDVRLQRDVALKVFDRLAVPDVLARLDAEARLASRLNHPGIVTIYGVGEDDRLAYIAMELVEGRTLRSVIGEGPLAPARVLDVAEQLADAMAVAHAAGIAHRDLKPENVVMSVDGRIRILDFGIASAPGISGWGSENAGPAPVVGTVGYMAPEQARGDRVGPPADQFAFAVICHEMLTGRRLLVEPTVGGDAATATHLDPADAVRLSRDEDLGPLTGVVRRCLAADPDHRYAETTALLRDVRAARAKASAGLTRRRAIAIGVAGLAAGVVAWQSWPGNNAIRSLAVLPFDNIAGDEASEYLCDGLTGTLISQLSQIPSLMVIARATAFTFKGRVVDPRDAGRRLGVQAVLTGSLARRAGRLRTSAELTAVSSGARLWAGDLDRPATDVLAVQSEIVDAMLSRGLGRALTDSERRRIRLVVDDQGAYDFFLQGVHQLRLGTEDGYLAARAFLEQAVARAPRFALAVVTLASTYTVMAIDGLERPAEAWARNEAYIRQALSIDPNLPDSYAEAAAVAFFHRWDWQEADRLWTRAASLRSEVQAELLGGWALARWAAGQPEAALAIARAGRQVDPLGVNSLVREADLLVALGRLDEAVAAYVRLVGMFPHDLRAHFGLAEAHQRAGRFDAAIDALRAAYASADDEALAGVLAQARGEAGYRSSMVATARLELAHLALRRDAGAYVSPLDLARAHAQAGDRADALAHLGAGLEERSPGMMLLSVDPVWNGFRPDPRFGAIVRKVGLPV